MGNSEKQPGRAVDKGDAREIMGNGEERELWKAITFLCGYSSLRGVVSSLCAVVTSYEVSSLRLVMQS